MFSFVLCAKNIMFLGVLKRIIRASESTQTKVFIYCSYSSHYFMCMAHLLGLRKFVSLLIFRPCNVINYDVIYTCRTYFEITTYKRNAY